MILKILTDEHPLLHKKSKPVQKFDFELKTLVQNMIETMYAAPGVGLAAVQVGVPVRVFVVDVSDEQNEAIVFVNPKIVSRSGEQIGFEGCLSVPGYYGKVKRSQKVLVQAWDIEGQVFEIVVEGFFARAIQHENDHLDGIVYVDKLVDGKKITKAEYDALMEKQSEKPPTRVQI